MANNLAVMTGHSHKMDDFDVEIAEELRRIKDKVYFTQRRSSSPPEDNF